MEQRTQGVPASAGYGSTLWVMLILVLLVGCDRQSEGEAYQDHRVEAQSKTTPRPNVVVIFTDDQGYADLGIQGVVEDVRTPHIDRLARNGVRFTDGYVTAPMCAPSRAGLLIGRYQQRYGVETNSDLPFDLTDEPIPQRLRRRGYRTGMSGKLHLRLRSKPETTPAMWGFDEYSMKVSSVSKSPNRRLSTHDLDGNPFADGAQWIEPPGYRIDADTDAALQFIDRNHERPFFLYVAYFAPHVPLEAPPHYLERFSNIRPEGRRFGLAMLAAIDDGVGRIVDKLREYAVAERTLIFFVSDNGAPLELGQLLPDAPVSELKRWNGSLNHPFLGEKSLLLEGGIRVPFIAHWPGVIPAGTVYREPVTTLDVGATALQLAGATGDVRLDGTNLVPHLTGETSLPPHDALFWVLGGQAAVREGKWKWLTTQTSGDFLFDLSAANPERHNLAGEHPAVAARLDAALQRWLSSLTTRGAVRESRLKIEARRYRAHVLDER